MKPKGQFLLWTSSQRCNSEAPSSLLHRLDLLQNLDQINMLLGTVDV